MRGCAPSWRRRSIRSRAQAIPASSASTSSSSLPTSVYTDRLWSWSEWTSSRRACPASAPPIASIVARSRPSEKFGTASSGSIGTYPTLRRRMTARKSSYRSLASLERDLARCRACVEAGYPLESLPVHAPGTRPARVPLRPGAGRRRGRGAPAVARPRRPDAPALARARRGRVLRSLLLRLGHALLPRPRASGRGDRTPTPREQELCAFWRDWELELLRPRSIVTVGGLALKRLLGLTTLTPYIGERYELRRNAASSRSRTRPARAAGSTTPANRGRLAGDRPRPRGAREPLEDRTPSLHPKG